MEKQREACAACRRLKIRCLDNDDKTRPCQRCQRVGETCEYGRKKRGRRPVIRDRVESTTFSTGHAMIGFGPGNPQSSGLPSLDIPSLSGCPPAPRPESSPKGLDDIIRPVTPGTATSTIRTTLTTHPGVDVASHLDPGDSFTSPDDHFAGGGPHARSGQAGAAGSATLSYDCPITLGLLSLGEAAMLVTTFHSHLNPMIALLDSTYHTLDRVRLECPCLLSSMLAAASKFVRPDLHKTLLQHSLAILSRSVAAGACNTGLVQSLMIHIYWKAPTDRTAWMKLGMAIRMGYQLRWHETRSRQAGLDEMSLRRVLDPERTWYCLFCEPHHEDPVPVLNDCNSGFDQTYSHAFKLPPTIPASHLADIRSWVDGHRHIMKNIDNHLAGSIDNLSLERHWDWMRESSIDPAEMIAIHVPEIRRRFQKYRDKWYRHPDVGDQTSDGEALFLDWLFTERRLAVEHYVVDHCHDPDEIEDGLSRCLAVISSAVTGVESLLGAGILRYLQDTTSLVLSKATTFLRQYFWKMNLAQQNLAISYLRRIYKGCIESAAGDQEAATAFVARFVRRTLREITNESTAPTRGISPAAEPGPSFLPLNNQPNQADPEPYLAELDQLLNATWLPENTVMDEEYWAALFTEVSNGSFFT